MDRIYIILLFSALTFCSALAQSADHSWGMENTADLKKIVRPIGSLPELHEGVLGKALYLDGKSTFLDLSNYLKLGKDFSLSFWFRPDPSLAKQCFFRQSRISKSNENEASRFIECCIDNQTGVVRNEQKFNGIGQLPHLNIIAQNDGGWLFFTLTGNQFGYHIYLQGQEVVSSSDGTMFLELGDYYNNLIIGKSNPNFTGLIDQVKIYYQQLDPYAINTILSADRKQIEQQAKASSGFINDVEVKPDSSLTMDNTTIPEEESKAIEPPVIDGRITKIHKTIRVDSDNIQIKLWDSYRRIDNDQISVFLNSEKNTIRKNLILKKRRRKQSLDLKLANQEENLLIFYAEHTGGYNSSASIGLEIEGYKEQFKLNPDQNKNIAIKIINTKHRKIKKEQLPDLLTNTTTTKLQFSLLKKQENPVKVKVEVEGKTGFYTLSLSDEPQTIKVNLKPEEIKNISIRKLTQETTGKTKVNLVVSDAHKQLKKRILYLDKKHYALKLERDAKIDIVENGNRKVKIKKDIKKITLEISDHDTPDADKISITYDQDTLIQNKELFAKAFQEIVSLKPTLSKHEIYIQADSFGTSQEKINTPRIRVLADGIEIDNFALQLQAGNNQDRARLEIVFEE